MNNLGEDIPINSQGIAWPGDVQNKFKRAPNSA